MACNVTVVGSGVRISSFTVFLFFFFLSFFFLPYQGPVSSKYHKKEAPVGSSVFTFDTIFTAYPQDLRRNVTCIGLEDWFSRSLVSKRLGHKKDNSEF